MRGTSSLEFALLLNRTYQHWETYLDRCVNLMTVKDDKLAKSNNKDDLRYAIRDTMIYTHGQISQGSQRSNVDEEGSG